MKKQKQPRVVIITGASHGIGLATKEYFEKRGDIVHDISRTSGTDITKPDQVAATIAKIHAEHNRIDVFINNAGFGISGSSEATTVEDINKLMSVNFTGTAICCSAVLPYMRAQKSGKIINVSSAAAVFALHYPSFYSASKAAVTSYSTALRREVASFGVRVCSALPGDVKTDFTAARKKNANEPEAYAARVEKAIAKYEHDELVKGGKPITIAKQLYKISKKRNPKPYIILGFKYKLLNFLTRFLPTRFVNWILGTMY